jgi:hypothetical protein
MMSVPALASDLSRYRDFHFGMNLAAVSGQAGPSKPEVKVIHSRPALIQEIEWSPPSRGSATRAESVQQVVLRFYDGKLFGIAVSYDRYETEGLTAGDVIEAISTMYGPPEMTTVPVKTGREGYDEELVAVWQDPDYRFELFRTAYGSSFRLVGISKRLESAAQTATTEAKRLDDKEAPEREAAKVANDEAQLQAKLDKSRLVNKPKFRP